MTSPINKVLETPESFFAAIPKTLQENLEFRCTLHDLLTQDKGMQKVFLELCWADLKILFNSTYWVYDPQAHGGFRHKPFILWPNQEPIVDELDAAIKQQYDLALDKSRKEGATELICKVFLSHWLLSPEFQGLLGSRKAEFVDKGVEIAGNKVIGLHKSLMHKVCYALVHLPAWMKPQFQKTYMLLQNHLNGAVISGEATNENFAAGDRQTAILVDEFGRVDHSMALSISDTVHDTSDCVIFNSTQFYGTEHPYNQLLTQRLGRIKVVCLPWETNPYKGAGLYRSPDYDMIEIDDIDYYRNICPEAFNDIEKNVPFKLSAFINEHLGQPYSETLDQITFVADGGDSNEGGWRSPVYDKEAEERRPQDMARNWDRKPLGSGNSVFTPATLRALRLRHVRPPSVKGDIQPIKRDSTVIGGRFYDSNKVRLKWWGPLVNNRPDQSHNYIIACDISLGTGASNSVAGIMDVNTSEVVGMWADPSTPPESFADVAVALCYWVGGNDNDPFLIWEANGPGGAFEREVVRQGYGFHYIRRNERDRFSKQKNQRGWWNSADSKYDAAIELDILLREGVKTEPGRHFLRLYDEETVGELESYIWSTTGVPIPAKQLEDSSGATHAHGDRVIVLLQMGVARKYAHPAKFKQTSRKPSFGTPAWRLADDVDEKETRFRTL